MGDYPARKPPQSEREQSGEPQAMGRISTPDAGSAAAKVVPQAESDLAQLAGLFAAHGGGNFSEQFSANLALEILLNEIVEQVCLSTGATGAAIVLMNGEEMVCRARSGATVPALGTRLAGASGLSGECLRTHGMQRCDDVLTDSRADAEASQSLGVRSVMIYPLLEGGEILGMLEIFSSRPAAFGQREENTLEAFAGRIRENLLRARGPFRDAEAVGDRKQKAEPNFGTLNPPPQAEVIPEAKLTVADSTDGAARAAVEKSSWGGFDYLMLALGAVVLACVVLLATLAEVRMAPGHSRAAARGRQSVTPVETAPEPVPGVAAGEESSPEQGIGRDRAVDSGQTAKAGQGSDSAARAEDRVEGKKPGSEEPTPGTLTVYENGKEVFHLNAGGEAGKGGGPVERASSVEREAGASSQTDGIKKNDGENFIVQRTEPEYPEAARAQGVQGAVVLQVRIGQAGGVEDVKLVSGSPLLAPSAMAAVKQWKFKPTLVNGRAVEMETTVTLNFKLPG
jgi:TonB family protein